jgi:membrane protein required for colicin V production
MMPYSITLSSLTTFDWFLVVVILVSTLAAFRRGLIKVLFSLAGVTAGILLASWNYHHVAEYLHRVIASSATANILAFVLILIAVTLCSAPFQPSDSVSWTAFSVRSSAWPAGCCWV